MLVIVLRMGISSAFFRFYFDSKDEATGRSSSARRFWFTMVMATAGLVVGFIFADADRRTRSSSATTLGSSAPPSSVSGRR